ncbi:MAG: hypothetical protein J5602_00845 [Clostridia bacterium]|nr:hypothetical protein [Clostridia bacterium]MBO4883833.1 hypothetical protein [Clostridia bacterium]
MIFLSNLLSSLIPWLLAMMLVCSLFIVLMRFFAEPFAPGIEFGSLVRRLVNRRALEPLGPVEEVSFTASRQLRRRLKRNQWALHTQLRLLVWIACVMLVSRLLILASAMVGSVLTGSLDKLFTAAISHWVRWDASDYIDLARLGYIAEKPELLIFLPLYPLIVRVVATLCLGHYVFAGFLVSNLCLMGSGWALYHIVNAQYGERTARRAVLLLMFAPLSLVFSVPYAESMFLMFTLLAVLFAHNRRFAWAGVFGMLSAATRLIGVLVFVPVFMESLKYLHTLDLRRRNPGRFFSKLGLYALTSLLIFLGTGVYLIVNRVVAGHPLAFVETLSTEWSQTFGSIWNTQSYSIQSAFNYGDIAWQLGTWIPQSLYIFAIALVILTMSTTIPPADGLYAWLYLVITMSPSWMLSGPRTLTSMYPLYIMLALVSRKKWYYVALMVISVMMMCFFGYMYALTGSVV